MGKNGNEYKILVENLKANDHFQNISVDERMIGE